jgi:hypothetical protein
MRAIERHLDVEHPRGDLADEARQLHPARRRHRGRRLDAPVRRAPEAMVDESRCPPATT